MYQVPFLRLKSAFLRSKLFVLTIAVFASSLAQAASDIAGCDLYINAEKSTEGSSVSDAEFQSQIVALMQKKNYIISHADNQRFKFLLKVRMSSDSGYHYAVSAPGGSSTSASLTVFLGRDADSYSASESIFNREHSGYITCTKWTGWLSHYSNSSGDSILGPVSRTWSAISDWSDRCDESHGRQDFAELQLEKRLVKDLAALPDCETAKTLPVIPSR